jgi:hypothetical protein
MTPNENFNLSAISNPRIAYGFFRTTFGIDIELIWHLSKSMRKFRYSQKLAKLKNVLSLCKKYISNSRRQHHRLMTQVLSDSYVRLRSR